MTSPLVTILRYYRSNKLYTRNGKRSTAYWRQKTHASTKTAGACLVQHW